MRTACQVTLALLTVLLAVCPPAQAEAKIVFSARFYKWGPKEPEPIGKYFHLYLADPHGNHPVRLTSGTFDDTDPKWSPDHKQIAFWRDDDLCTMTFRNHHISHLYRTEKDEYVDAYEWRPQSHQISLILRGSTASSDKYRFVLLEGTKVLWLQKNVQEFAWSPDRTHVFFRDSHDRCAVMNMATRQSKPVSHLENPAWLDDAHIIGKRWDKDDLKIYVVNAVSGRLSPYPLTIHDNKEQQDAAFHLLDGETEISWHRSPKYKNEFVVDVGYEMSDGWHHLCCTAILGPTRGVATAVGGYIAGVAFGGYSACGTEFACYSAEWMGTYKWGGSELGPLEIRDRSGRRIRFLTHKMVMIDGASWY